MHNRNLYWRKVRRFTFILVLIWFLTTFGVIFFARELAEFTLFGWPLSFYMAAQGLTLLYLVIVAAYVARMRRLDRFFRSEISDGR
ncbi:DUF4212 domain-containing protein [Herbaspirillum sp. HC18]|nr:DUF4212 domain-containing protein [Herbaspirillum sp. HC18]